MYEHLTDPAGQSTAFFQPTHGILLYWVSSLHDICCAKHKCNWAYSAAFPTVSLTRPQRLLNRPRRAGWPALSATGSGAFKKRLPPFILHYLPPGDAAMCTRLPSPHPSQGGAAQHAPVQHGVHRPRADVLGLGQVRQCAVPLALA